MKRTAYAFVLAALTFAGCAKVTPTPNHSSNDSEPGYFTKNVTLTGLKVAERINGIVVCTIDEEILKSAISNYYGATVTRRMIMKQFKPNSPNPFYAIKGRVKQGNTITRYAFELIPNELLNGTVDLYLPVPGTEQHVVGPKGNICKLKLTSASTGNIVIATSNNSCSTCQGTYGTSVSVVSTDQNGTNKLITEIEALL